MRVVPLVAGLLAVGGCGTASIGDRPDLQVDGAPSPQVDGAPSIDATAPDARVCAGGDARVSNPLSGHCYIYVGTPGTWVQGEAACLLLGGHLATATSAAEVAILTDLPTMPTTMPDVWLGGDDLDTEGTFLWETAEVMTYTNWKAGEPNNGGTSGNQEDCMVIESDTLGTWDDRPCARSYPALCELP